MNGSVVLHITETGYSVIASALAGLIEDFKINKVKLGGGLNLPSLTPYLPSIKDTEIPNVVMEIGEEYITGMVDTVDNVPIIKVVIPSEGIPYDDVYLNAVGLYYNDYLIASNSLAMMRIHKGMENILYLKIPFLHPTELANFIPLVEETEEEVKYNIEYYKYHHEMLKIPAGFSGNIYSQSFVYPVVYARLVIKVNSITPIHIDHIRIRDDLHGDWEIIVPEVILEHNKTRTLDIVIPDIHKEIEVKVLPEGNDAFYDISYRALVLFPHK
jgi:hypothetical protein